MSENLTLVAMNDSSRGETVRVRVDGLHDHRDYLDDPPVTLTLVAGEDFYEGSIIYQPIPGLAMVDAEAPRRQEPNPPAPPD